jgi:flagellar basal-body rod modification protein FlgD
MDLLSMSTIAPSAAANRVAQSLSQATAASASTSTPSASASTANTDDISSSDFLTLLVAEMKNQDPTQPTDPNAYIQQLVGVNSLQQLISINQDLTGGSTSGTTASGTTQAVSGS